jgi:hypothetical protein
MNRKTKTLLTASKKFDTIKALDMMNAIYPIKCTIIEYKTHGYNLKSGAWCLYPDKDGTSTHAKFIGFRKYRKRKVSWLNMKRVVSINGEATK